MIHEYGSLSDCSISDQLNRSRCLLSHCKRILLAERNGGATFLDRHQINKKVVLLRRNLFNILLTAVHSDAFICPSIRDCHPLLALWFGGVNFGDPDSKVHWLELEN